MFLFVSDNGRAGTDQSRIYIIIQFLKSLCVSLQ